MAYRCLLRLCVSSLPVRPEEMLARCDDTVLYTYDEAAAARGITVSRFREEAAPAEAFTVLVRYDNGSTGRLIYYDREAHPARLRFSLAHELAHIVLGHTDEDPAADAEANHFALCLLCPPPVVHMAREKGCVWQEQLMKLFYVSSAAAQRAVQLTAAAENAALAEEVAAMLAEAVQVPPLPEKMNRHRIG